MGPIRPGVPPVVGPLVLRRNVTRPRRDGMGLAPRDRSRRWGLRHEPSHAYHQGVMGEWQHGNGLRDATLQRIVAALRPWRPERIILFGSPARGDARPESDLDILVILPDAHDVTRRTLVDMRLAIGAVPVAYDLLITSHADFEWRRDALAGSRDIVFVANPDCCVCKRLIVNDLMDFCEPDLCQLEPYVAGWLRRLDGLRCIA